MTYPNTPAQQAQKVKQAHIMDEALVPKDLRRQALAISDTFTGEKRTHAYSWLKSHRRTRSQIEAFIERNQHALPDQACGGAVQSDDVAPAGGSELPG